MATDANKTRSQLVAELAATSKKLATLEQQLQPGQGTASVIAPSQAQASGFRADDQQSNPDFLSRKTELEQAHLEIELNRRRFETLRGLTQRIHDPEQKILDFALEAGVQATDSRIGYIYFVNKDETELTLNAWSKAVMEQCRVDSPPKSYKVAEIGLWGEAVRRRRPIITNDYPPIPTGGNCLRAMWRSTAI
ncbi:MAG: GAF domain-containing protein [Syntrophotaleaceae bacterium]